MKIAVVAPEAAPFSKTGGLGDAVPALCRALAEAGARVRLYLPLHGTNIPPATETRALSVPLGEELLEARLVESSLPDSSVGVTLVDQERFFGRPGVYDDPATGESYPDDGLRFVFFQRAVVEALRADHGDEGRPNLVHLHDHQTGLVPWLLRQADLDLPSVFTVHNLGYQGSHPPELLGATGLPAERLAPMAPLELHGRLSMMKAGLTGASWVTTVSPRYAADILTPEGGFGLDGVLRERRQRLTGILNGVDVETWNPADDPALPAPYDRDRMEGKKRCRRHLLEETGLAPPGPSTAVLGWVGRLAWQKGMDWVLEILDPLLEEEADLRLVVLGTGEKRLEAALSEAARRHPGRLAARLGYDEGLAHRITAGADLLLMPSRYEPCGLNQLYAMRYGTPPLARETGGLADTVRDVQREPQHGTGFLFEEPTAGALLRRIREALLWRREHPEAWEEMQRRAMSIDLSWDRAARAYLEVFRQARELPPSKENGP